MEEDLKAYEEALEALGSNLPPLGIASFLPLIEEGLGAILSRMPDREKVQALARFRASLGSPTIKPFKNSLLNCRRCPNLQRPVIPGEGPTNPRVALIGEAPGETEHQQGQPFVGRAGKLLREVLGEAGFSPEDTYFTNAVKCFPPPQEEDRKNSKPTPTNVSNCRPWLAAELELIAPKIIVLLGSVALSSIFANQKITKARGSIFRVGVYHFMPTFHPSYILRNMSKRPIFLEDLQLAERLTRSKI